jgi:hypothetical protein
MATRRKPRGAAADALARRELLIDKALRLIEQRIDNEQMNASLADMVRLLELAGEAPGDDRQVTAGWIDDNGA